MPFVVVIIINECTGIPWFPLSDSTARNLRLRSSTSFLRTWFSAFCWFTSCCKAWIWVSNASGSFKRRRFSSATFLFTEMLIKTRTVWTRNFMLTCLWINEFTIWDKSCDLSSTWVEQIKWSYLKNQICLHCEISIQLYLWLHVYKRTMTLYKKCASWDSKAAIVILQLLLRKFKSKRTCM